MQMIGVTAHTPRGHEGLPMGEFPWRPDPEDADRFATGAGLCKIAAADLEEQGIDPRGWTVAAVMEGGEVVAEIGHDGERWRDVAHMPDDFDACPSCAENEADSVSEPMPDEVRDWLADGRTCDQCREWLEEGAPLGIGAEA